MMLPRMTFKAELVINQLKQQHKLDDALGSLSTVNPSKADQLAFVCTLIFKLTNLTTLVNQANRFVWQLRLRAELEPFSMQTRV